MQDKQDKRVVILRWYTANFWYSISNGIKYIDLWTKDDLGLIAITKNEC